MIIKVLCIQILFPQSRDPNQLTRTKLRGQSQHSLTLISTLYTFPVESPLTLSTQRRESLLLEWVQGQSHPTNTGHLSVTLCHDWASACRLGEEKSVRTQLLSQTSVASIGTTRTEGTVSEEAKHPSSKSLFLLVTKLST